MEEKLSQRIDAIFSRFDHTNTPGCALALLKDGSMVYQRCYGMANLEHGVPIKPETRFQIGSISKHFTAMCVLLLEKEKKLSLDDDIRKYLPEMPDFGRTITIRHMIHHISGLRGSEIQLFAGTRDDDIIVMEDVLEIMSRQRELNFAPGEKYMYCNSAYTLLAIIVERVSGQPIHEFARQRLFEPLGMKNTLFHHDYRLVLRDFASSYSSLGEGEFGWTPLLQAIPGSTSIITNLADLALWDEEFYEGKVVGMDVIEKMHVQGVLNSGKQIAYAAGLEVSQYRGLKIVEHGGSHAGFRADLMRFPEQHFSIILLSNFGGVIAEELARKVADIFLEGEFKDERQHEEHIHVIQLSASQLDSLAGLYMCPEKHSTHRLFVRDQVLYIAFGEGIPLEAVAPDRLRLVPSPILELHFKTSETGEKQMHLVVLAEEPVVYTRVERWFPSDDILAQFCGNYYSPELDYSHDVLLKEGRLYFRVKKLGLAPMESTITDAFVADLTHLLGGPFKVDMNFERDSSGQVKGMRLHGGRFQNLWFDKR